MTGGAGAFEVVVLSGVLSSLRGGSRETAVRGGLLAEIALEEAAAGATSSSGSSGWASSGSRDALALRFLCSVAKTSNKSLSSSSSV